MRNTMSFTGIFMLALIAGLALNLSAGLAVGEELAPGIGGTPLLGTSGERLQLNGIDRRLNEGDPLFDMGSELGLLDGSQRVFEPLFNGVDLEGWQEIDGGDTENWGVEDGILYTTGQTHNWLATEKEYSDFELSLEFRLEEGGNSGVFIRAPKEGNPAFEGMEIQILDDYAEKWAELKDWQYSGSLYAIAAPSERVSKPAGEWQHFFIRCEGSHIQIRYNGVDIIDVNLEEAVSFEANHPGMHRSSGHIGLQDHGDRVEFRNINIRELE